MAVAGPITADLIKSAQAAEMRNKGEGRWHRQGELYGASSSMIKANSRESSR